MHPDSGTFARIGLTLARFVALGVALLGLWVLVGNLADIAYSGWTLAAVLLAGAAGALGGAAYLLSFDGPPRMQTMTIRRLGWSGMLALALLPSSLSLVLLLVILALMPTLFARSDTKDDRRQTAFLPSK